MMTNERKIVEELATDYGKNDSKILTLPQDWHSCQCWLSLSQPQRFYVPCDSAC